MSKIAVKTLTGSDLTLFEWHFRNRNAGNQKSINLNANVFIDELYPYLSNTDVGRVGRIPIDLYLYGPGDARVWNLQRKIIKGGTYKNWRLNGEYIPNPLENPTRFNVLVPGDYAIFEFEGELYPTAARVVFVAQNLPDDAGLYQGLTHHGIDRMAAMELSRLRLIVHASGVPESHPVFELLLDAAIEDAAQGGIEGIRKLQSRATGRKMSRSELERARQRADDVGRMGEELIDGYFGQQKSSGAIQDYEWVAAVDAISPFDFRITAGVREKVEVKSTCGNFLQVIHISVGQLIEMQGAEPYSLYRVYALDERTGKLRIAKGLKPFADSVLLHLNALPAGVKADGISVKPDVFTFGNEIEIELSEDEEPDE